MSYSNFKKLTKPLDDNNLMDNNYVHVHSISKPKFSKSAILKSDVETIVNSVISKHISSNKLTTEPYSIYFDDCNWIIYIDLDYYYKPLETNLETVDETLVNINKQLSDIVVDLLPLVFPNVEYKYLSFIPDVSDDDSSEDNDKNIHKGGVHTFVILESGVTTEERNRYYNNFKDYFSQHDSLNVIDSNYYIYEHKDTNWRLRLDDNYNHISKIIDETNFKRTSSILLPFCKKSVESRNYILCDHSTEFNYPNSFKIPEDTQDVEFCQKQYKPTDVNTVEGCKNNLLAKISELSNNNHYLRVCFEELFEFMVSLTYLSDKHPFVPKFSKGVWSGDKTYKPSEFIKRLINFTYVLFYPYVEINEKIDRNIRDITYYLLNPLYKRGGKTNFDDIGNQIHSTWKFLRDNEYTRQYYNKLGDVNIRVKYFSNDKEDKEAHEASVMTINPIINHFVNEFFSYLDNEVYRHITNELLPFSEDNYVRSNDSDSNKFNKHFYYHQLGYLVKMYVVIQFYNKGQAQNFDSILQDSCKMLMKHFIYVDSNKKTTSVYVYNFKQIVELSNYPYNQWLYIGDGETCKSILKIWVKQLNDNIYNPMLGELNEGNKFLKLYLSLITKVYPLVNIYKNLSPIKLLVNTSPESKFLDSCIVELLKSTINNFKIKKYETSNCNYLAVQNGILEYKYNTQLSKYTCDLVEDSYHILLQSHCSAMFYKDYNIDNIYYKTITEVLKSVYPLESEREFMLQMFSSAVCPMIKKDKFMFVYGKGSDGKSTISSILSLMLGSCNGVTKYRDGKSVNVQNTKAYASSMDANTLTDKKNRGGCDEGGVINLFNRTLCIIQEPSNSEIITSYIKDWTSQGQTHAREMYQSDVQFISNCLIICETNNLPKFDVTDDAIRRRVVVYNHKSKFVTTTNKPYYKLCNQNFIKNANQELIDTIRSNMEYWDALLHILIQYALNILNNGRKFILSDITTPSDIIQFTDKTFGSSSNLGIWLDRNIIYQDIEHEKVQWMSIKELINHIQEAHNQFITDSILTTDEKNNNSLIITRLTEKYRDRIFQLKSELIGKNSVGKFILDNLKLNNVIAEINTSDSNYNEIIDKYTTGSALTDINVSLSKGYDDLVIMGISLIQ